MRSTVSLFPPCLLQACLLMHIPSTAALRGGAVQYVPIPGLLLWTYDALEGQVDEAGVTAEPRCKAVQSSTCLLLSAVDARRSGGGDGRGGSDGGDALRGAAAAVVVA